MRVAVTRERARAAGVCSALRSADMTPLLRSLVRTERLGAQIDEAVRAVMNADWLVFTSAEAVRALDDAGAFRAAPAWLREVKVACTGPSTAAAAERAGLRVALVPDVHDGVHLARALQSAPGDWRGVRVVWPRAEGAAMHVANTLRSSGADVIDIPVYRTLPCPPGGARLQRDLAAGRLDAVAFFSPSAVDAFVGLGCVLQPDVRVAVIGATTAARADSYGLPVHVSSEDNTVAGLVRGLRDDTAWST